MLNNLLFEINFSGSIFGNINIQSQHWIILNRPWIRQTFSLIQTTTFYHYSNSKSTRTQKSRSNTRCRGFKIQKENPIECTIFHDWYTFLLSWLCWGPHGPLLMWCCNLMYFRSTGGCHNQCLWSTEGGFGGWNHWLYGSCTQCVCNNPNPPLLYFRYPSRYLTFEFFQKKLSVSSLNLMTK